MTSIFGIAAPALALAVVLTGGPAAAASIVNGGFEDPDTSVPVFSVPSQGLLTGWTVGSGNVEIIKNTYWEAAEGDQSVDLNGVLPGSIWQDIGGLAVGSVYRILFDMSANPLAGANIKQVSVTVGSASETFSFDRAQPGFGYQNMLWSERALEFTAGATTERLSFLDVSGGGAASGPALDNVRIELVSATVPVPAAAVLLIGGLGALAGLRRNRGPAR